MLGHTFRFGINNNSIGATIDAGKATIKSRMWKGSNDGTRVNEGSEGSIYSNDSAIASDAFGPYDTYDNSTNEYEGGDFELSVTFDKGDQPDGVVEVYYQTATDGATFDSNNAENNKGRMVCALQMAETTALTAEKTYVKSFSL